MMVFSNWNLNNPNCRALAAAKYKFKDDANLKIVYMYNH